MAPHFVFSRLSFCMIAVLLASACTIDVDEPTESGGDNTEPTVVNEVQATETTPSDQTDGTDTAVSPSSSDVTAEQNPDTGPDAGTDTGLTTDETTNPTTDTPPGTPSGTTPATTPDNTPDSTPDSTPDPNSGPGTTTDSTPEANIMSDPSLDQSGIATSAPALVELLTTDYVLENGQIIPTTGWICTDVFNEKRVYFFYEAGVLNPLRNIAIERTLNSDDAFSDINFFWSVTSTDSVLLSSVISGDNGNLVTTGQQYDVSTIRFSEVDSKPVFSAQSLLRGRLTCEYVFLRISHIHFQFIFTLYSGLKELFETLSCARPNHCCHNTQRSYCFSSIAVYFWHDLRACTFTGVCQSGNGRVWCFRANQCVAGRWLRTNQRLLA